MEKIGIYCRVSSKTQEDDGTSIDYQIKMGNEISRWEIPPSTARSPHNEHHYHRSHNIHIRLPNKF